MSAQLFRTMTTRQGRSLCADVHYHTLVYKKIHALSMKSQLFSRGAKNKHCQVAPRPSFFNETFLARVACNKRACIIKGNLVSRSSAV